MNNNIIEFLNSEISENKISHAFLVETNNCETLMNDIFNIFSKSKLIPEQNIENNIAINIIRPENNLIDKNKILDLQKFTITKSILNKYKIYFIINAEFMNLSSFNKLLKVLEEPSDNVIGFLITENENQIISTIKSRCKRFKYLYESNIDENYDNFLNILINIKKLNFSEILDLKKEIMSKDKLDIIKMLENYRNILIKELTNQEEISTLANYYKILDNIIELIKSNVNLELCLDKMFIEMRK